jgi:beta-fructofuranosidase
MIDRGGKRDGRFVAMPLWEFNRFDEAGWHDVVVRVKDRRTELFVDGVLRDRRDVGAVYAQEHAFFPEPASAQRKNSWCSIGVDPGRRYPFHGDITHVAVWHRAIRDEEIRVLSGGKLDATWKQPTGWSVLATFPPGTSLEDRNAWIDRQMQQALGDALQRDPHFPHYHLAPPGDAYNFTALFHEGRYHVFPIFNYGWWGTLNMSDTCAWAHFSSADLVHWQLDPQLPKPCTVGANGCLAAHEGTVYALTGWGPRSFDDASRFGLNYLVSTDPRLRVWQRPDDAPLAMPDPPGWRGEDCDIFRRDDAWYMVASSAKPNAQGVRSKQIQLFRSADLRHWHYVGVFYEVGVDHAPECVNIFPLGDKYVLTACQRMHRDCEYLVGRIEANRFLPETRGLWNHAAAEGIPTATWSVRDARGRRILWQWLEGRHFFNLGLLSIKERFKAGWDQAYSLPQVVSPRADGTLALAPVPELERLRGAHEALRPGDLPAGATCAFSGTLGAQQEIRAMLTPSTSGQAGIALTQGKDRLEIYYDAGGRHLVCDFRGAVRARLLPQPMVRLPLQLGANEPLDLRLFVDGAIMEVYANGGKFLYGRWYADDPRQIRADLFARGAPAQIRSADAWRMGTIWPK